MRSAVRDLKADWRTWTLAERIVAVVMTCMSGLVSSYLLLG